MCCLLVLIAVLHYNSIRKRSFLTRSAIQHPKLSPGARVYVGADDRSFLELTGTTRAAFSLLEELYFPSGTHPRKKRGRPKLLNSKGQLGLLLFFLNSTMRIKHLCLLFGLHLQRHVRYLMTCLKKQLTLLQGTPVHVSSSQTRMR